jgi:hypothetical protein
MSKTIKPMNKVFPKSSSNSSTSNQIKEMALEEDKDVVMTGKPLEDTNTAKVKKKIKKVGKSIKKASLFANSNASDSGKINLGVIDKDHPVPKECNINKGLVSIPVKLNRTEVYKIKKKTTNVSAFTSTHLIPKYLSYSRCRIYIYQVFRLYI